jgi:branched-chain amino acid transport system substrate-binding protein
MTIVRIIAVVVLSLVVAAALPARAADPIRLGVAAGISGYLANIDRGWRDGVLVAAEKVNRDGGVLGRPLEVIVEDMRS